MTTVSQMIHEFGNLEDKLTENVFYVFLAMY